MENFIDALFTALLSALGVFIIRWVDAITKHLDKLSELIQGLTQRVDTIERERATKKECESMEQRLQQNITRENHRISKIETKIGGTTQHPQDK